MVKNNFLPSEQIIFGLRSLYDAYGYTRYKMSKFEEYDLYSRNKDFLISDGVITFTDPDGKLMALKPDVTLSIIKNSKDLPDSVQKVYYNENVYRVAKGTRAFREIMQVGLECIGRVDDYRIAEVLQLAAKSLLSIEKDCILDVSHLGLLSDVIDGAGVPADEKREVLRLIGEKNLHEITAKCRDLGVSEQSAAVLKRLIAIHGAPDEVMPELKKLLTGVVDAGTLSQFENIIGALSKTQVKDILRIDFSVVDDLHYYNGFIFKGFAQGVPNSILSGGQYDTLMKKMKRKSSAIGFAVYLDALEQLNRVSPEYDVDAVLLYDDRSSVADIQKQVDLLTAQGKSVSVQRQCNGIKYRQLLKLQNGEVEILENNA